jgi:hypothetical protein
LLLPAVPAAACCCLLLLPAAAACCCCLLLLLPAAAAACCCCLLLLPAAAACARNSILQHNKQATKRAHTTQTYTQRESFVTATPLLIAVYEHRSHPYGR